MNGLFPLSEVDIAKMLFLIYYTIASCGYCKSQREWLSKSEGVVSKV